MNRHNVIKKLSDAKTDLLQYGVSVVGLFGSTVRGENKPGSDIDILIDFDTDSETYANFIAVCHYLEQLFKNQRLDIVTKKGLSPHIGKQILNEVEYV